MKKIFIAIFCFVLSCSATTYTIHVTDTPVTIYTTLQNAVCGDTVNINAGTYSAANSNIELFYISGKACSAGTILLIQASDPLNKPLFDYTGTPLDGGSGACGAPFPTVIPHSYVGSDYMRGAWQITNSSYVTFDGILFKGATSCAQSSVAGLRINSNSGASLVDHVTVRNSTFQQNWDGIFSTGTNILGENNVFISNGQPQEDQEHQWYDGGGDNLTIRYNAFLGQGCGGCSLDIGTGVDDTCCMQTNGTTRNNGGGQNLHSRSWDSFIYGNWFQDARDYEWDMSAPGLAYVPGRGATDMFMQFYGNVLVGNATPANGTKVMVFTAYMPIVGNCTVGLVGCPNLTMHLDAQWNTFYPRFDRGTGHPCLGGGSCNEYEFFQINNYTAAGGTLPGTVCIGCDALGAVALHFANNIMNFVHDFGVSSYNHTFINAAGNGNPWTITGNNNWFGAPDRGGVINNCITLISVWNGTCLLTSTTNNVTSSPPFLNLAALNLTPTSTGAFGSADTTQTLKAPKASYSPASYTVLGSYNDIGALQFATTPQALQPTCLPGSGTYSSTTPFNCSDGSSGAIMCYTTDGTTPATNTTTGCTNGTLYSTTLMFNSSITFKIIAGGTGFLDSTVASYSYAILSTVMPWPPAFAQLEMH